MPLKSPLEPMYHHIGMRDGVGTHARLRTAQTDPISRSLAFLEAMNGSGLDGSLITSARMEGTLPAVLNGAEGNFTRMPRDLRNRSETAAPGVGKGHCRT